MAAVDVNTLAKTITKIVIDMVDQRLKQYDRTIVKNAFKNLKIDGTNIKQNSIDSVNLTNTLNLRKFEDLQADFASFFAVESHTIMADWIKTGHLNTQDVEIYAGSNLRFLINGEGIFGFFQPTTGDIDITSYVQFSESGFRCVKNNVPLIELDWDGMRFKEIVDGTAYESLVADSTGKLWLKRRLTVGEDPYDGIYIDGETGSIGSSQYSSGQMGTGWKVSKDGSAQFNNIRARGTLTASCFEHDTLSAVGGSLYVAPSLIPSSPSPISIVAVDGEDYYSVTLTHPFTGLDHYAAGMSWTTNDLISIQGLVELTDSVYEIRDLRCKISEFTETGCTLLSVSPVSSIISYDEDTGNPFDAGTIDLSTGSIAPNSAFIFIGTLGSGGEILRRGILISASDTDSPYIDVYDSTESDMMPKLRLGNLDGIEDSLLRVNPSGYGIYTNNAFLRGSVYANGGRIGGINIDEHTLSIEDGTVGIGDTSESSPAGDYAFWAGNVLPSSAPYRVDKYGHFFIGNENSNHISFDGEDLTVNVDDVIFSASDGKIAFLSALENDVRESITFDENGISIGRTGSIFKSNFSASKLEFSQNGNVISRYENGKFFVDHLEANQDLAVGNDANGGRYVFITTPNGMALKWRAAATV